MKMLEKVCHLAALLAERTLQSANPKETWLMMNRWNGARGVC